MNDNARNFLMACCVGAFWGTICGLFISLALLVYVYG